jgi:hypothetical protein
MAGSALDRFVMISGHPTLPPGRCIGCGTTGATDYIDTQVQIQFFGRIYICVSCWKSTAMRNCGMVPQHNVDTVKADLDVASKLLHQAVARIKELEGVLASADGLRSAIDSIGTVDYSAATQPESPANESEVRQGLLGDSSQLEFPIDGPESGSSEQDSERGYSDILDDDGGDELSELINRI